MSEDSSARHEFTSEAEEILETLSRDLMKLEAEGREVRPELINKLFREVHSLKGLAGMLELDEISELSHALEDMLDRLRMGKIEVTSQLTDVLYESLEGLNLLILAMRDSSLESGLDLAGLKLRIHQLSTATGGDSEADPIAEIELDEQTRRSLTEYEEHRLEENIRSGKQIASVEATFDFSDFDEKLRELTALLAEAGEVISTLPAMDSSGGSGISFRLLCGTSLGIAALVDLVGDKASVRSLRRGAETPQALEVSPVPESPVDEEVSLRSLSRTVRVDIARLDHVMNVVGELIIEKSRLESLSKLPEVRLNRPLLQELNKVIRNFDRKLAELQRSVIETRMVPVEQIYSKLSRTVRKVARELDKEIDLVLKGEDTELDKMMVEELTDPLMHLLRNALDHGIEPLEQRVALGKASKGTVSLDAYQKGSSVVIEVSDDGRGIDPERIRAVAIRRGVIGANDPVDSARAHELLFTPGFSTATSVSEISGRGVGLDVVRRNIEDLKGSIEVLSTIGRGTTFRITLPITLAIIQALLVRSAGETFAIPLITVTESLRIERREIATVEQREVLLLRDKTIPLLRLADAFNLADDDDSEDRRLYVVVSRVGDRVAGILVDELVRQQEIVIKSIGQRLKSTAGIAGATETGDREIVLVVDVASLIDHFGGRARDARRHRHSASA
ncbi:MAG TPA: chemotaxis protein CheA [Thermoanaerobaculia bacterium]|nr:chemotaxis protein CheA [Thermoanaerobaculia bacterium]